MQTTLMNEIADTASRTEKERLLAQADEHTQKMLQYALDPYRTYGVTLNKKAILRAAQRPLTTIPQPLWWNVFEDLLDRLARRSLTGHAATAQLTEHFAHVPSLDDAEWALRVLHKKLRCGVSTKTALNVFPGLVQPFEVALAKAWNGMALQGIGYVEPKLDGLRVTVVDGIARTRNGNEVSATDAMIDELASLIGNARLQDWVFDGEFIGKGSFEDTISRARKSGSENRGLVYNIFDMVTRDEWMNRETRPFSDRRRDIEYHIRHGGQFVQRVESVPVTDATPQMLLHYCNQWMTMGFEGAMYKADEPYRFKRSSALLKVKKFDTEDARVVGFEEGTGKYEGLLGALVVQLDDGTKVKVGTGFSDAERETFWGCSEQLLGRTAELKYQNKTAKGSLRFPVFMCFRDDK